MATTTAPVSRQACGPSFRGDTPEARTATSGERPLAMLAGRRVRPGRVDRLGQRSEISPESEGHVSDRGSDQGATHDVIDPLLPIAAHGWAHPQRR